MANASSVKGKIIMSRDFYEKNKNLIKKFFSNGGEYGFRYISDEPDVYSDEVEINFDGCGRWNFSDTIPYVWNECKCFEEILKKEKPSFFLHYFDYEPCNQMFVEESSSVTFDTDEKEKLLVYCEVIESDDVALTDNNKVSLGFENGYTVEELKEKGDTEIYLKGLLKAIHEELDEYVQLTWDRFKEVFCFFVERDKGLQGMICEDTLEYFSEYEVFERLVAFARA